jgi:hypothetical protein
MRKYKPVYFPEVDLDDPKTYDYLPKDYKSLRNLMFREIGYAICYMDYFPNRKGFYPKEKQKPDKVRICDMFPNQKSKKLIDIANVSYKQRKRVEKMIKFFAENEDKHMKDLMWFKEQIFLFQDEIENMC